MTQQHDIVRRPDGSIDTDFYACEAVLLRRAARLELIGSLPRRVARLISRAWRGVPGAGRRAGQSSRPS